jgi:hypothetical protein
MASNEHAKRVVALFQYLAYIDFYNSKSKQIGVENPRFHIFIT